jgi:hypothetical protein
MRDNERAFPVFDSKNPDFACTDSGLTKKEHAAIHFKAPRSGDPDIDEMIRESRRADFATNTIDTAFCQYVAVGKKNPSIEETVATAYKIADAMLAELEK